MIQKFIELGEGYSDLYELIELGNRMPERIHQAVAFYSEKNNKPVCSLALIMKPALKDKFQPIYICREGIPNPHEIPNQRFTMFQEMVENSGLSLKEFTIKPSVTFPETALYYQYLTGILRTNKMLPPLS
ncbi:methylthioribose kinase [Halobacillus salinarum]|uniref:Methylthioribose kinase n=1 Tax=Halobacillus salinarum TaxID=2932257 RepID=A0ABY4EGG5_9BACI|nr:methylthioribose kinase [Halobacillus salinarum]UOQ43153.1 methylthioribose kinase [Halobacillus salinarum]